MNIVVKSTDKRSLDFLFTESPLLLVEGRIF